MARVCTRGRSCTDALSCFPICYVERYNRTVRTEWLGRYHFESIEEVQDHATRWLWTYNNERPNMGIVGMTPIQKLKAA